MTAIQQKKKEWYTYALVDPRDTSIFYVGLTDDIRARYSSHMYNREVNRAKNAIVDELVAEGILPYFRRLEVSSTKRSGEENERCWIEAFLTLGEPLTNVEATGRQR